MKTITRRAHGFTGQRMTMVPVPTIQRMARHPLLQGLFVVGSGFFPKAAGHFIQRRQGDPNELLIACVRGQGLITIEDRSFSVRAGDVAWLPANRAHTYQADAADPWTILWAHFNGAEVNGWRQLIFGEAPSFQGRVAPERFVELQLDRVHGILEKGYSAANLIETAAAFRVTLSTLSRLLQRPGATPSTHARVAASVEHLRQDWRNHQEVRELALQCGISMSHYTNLFRQQTGFSPIDFVLRQRIQRAAQLLVDTRDSIASIAAVAGFEDSFYFSRCFRKIMGDSPRDFRKKLGLS